MKKQQIKRTSDLGSPSLRNHRKIQIVLHEDGMLRAQVNNDTMFDDYFFRKKPLIDNVQHEAGKEYMRCYVYGVQKLTPNKTSSFILPGGKGQAVTHMADYQVAALLKYRRATKAIEREAKRIMDDMCDGHSASVIEKKYRLPKSYVVTRLRSILDTLAVEFGLMSG